MKRFTIHCAIVLVSFLFFGCGGKPGDVLEKMQGQDLADYRVARKFYTTGTMKALEELGGMSPNSKQENAIMDKKFVSGARWKIVNERIDGDTAQVIVKYTMHPIENMKGLEIPFRLRKEDGTWKIDMENELRASIEIMKEMQSKTGFINKLKSILR